MTAGTAAADSSAESNTTAATAAPKNPDPWQPLNRKLYGFNKFFDRWLLKPVAKGYDKVMPDPLQRGVSNVFDNLLTPWVAANQFFQAKPRNGFSDLARFFVNTTMGIGGIFDIASRGGIAKHEEDFGQTLLVWGLPAGPYLVIPFLGPSTVTTAVGRIPDSYANPIRYIENERTRYGIYALFFIDTRARLLEAETLISGDEYLFIRDAYLQRRQFLVDDGKVEVDPFYDEEFEIDD